MHVCARVPGPGGGNSPEETADGLKRSVGDGNVKFVQAEGKEPEVTSSHGPLPSRARIPVEQPAREEVAMRKASVEQLDGDIQRAVVEASTSEPLPVMQYNSYDQQSLYQMGIPYVNLDPRKPYVPEQRLVHFDLKGAPPKVSSVISEVQRGT
jgi:hypothetical protein